MTIEISDKVFGSNNYEYEILINGKKNDFNINDKREIIFDTDKNDIVEIRARNIVFSCRWGWILTLLYWILALLTGSGEREPFGKPFDAYIKFKSNSKYIKLQANKIWNKEAFDIICGEVIVEKNEFASSKKYIMRWCWAIVIPVNLLIIAIIALFLFTGVVTNSIIMVILFCVPVFGLLGWNIYVYKLLRVLKKMIND